MRPPLRSLLTKDGLVLAVYPAVDGVGAGEHCLHVALVQRLRTEQQHKGRVSAAEGGSCAAARHEHVDGLHSTEVQWHPGQCCAPAPRPGLATLTRLSVKKSSCVRPPPTQRTIWSAPPVCCQLSVRLSNTCAQPRFGGVCVCIQLIRHGAPLFG